MNSICGRVPYFPTYVLLNLSIWSVNDFEPYLFYQKVQKVCSPSLIPCPVHIKHPEKQLFFIGDLHGFTRILGTINHGAVS